MQCYQCKCGEIQSYGSMPPTRCASCHKCGSNLASGPHLHREPEPHSFVTFPVTGVDQAGVTKTVCRYCHKTKAQIEARSEKRDGT